MRKEMKKTMCAVSVIFCMTVSLLSAGLIDNFESYNTGNVRDVANPPWQEVNSGTGYADIESAENNQFLTYGWSNTGGYVRGAYIGVSPVSESLTAVTLFTRIYAEMGDLNHSFGLSDNASPSTGMSYFEVQIVGNNGPSESEFTLKANDAGNFTSYATLDRETWYNVWAVVDQSTDTFDLYLTGGSADAAEADKIATGVGFRNGTTDDLVTFFAASYAEGQKFRVDDIYLSDGVALAHPVPEPMTMLLLGCGSFILLGRKK